MNARLPIALLFCATLAFSAEIPAGTEIQARLTTPVVVSTAKADQAVDAVVVAPVMIDGGIVLSPGTKLSGKIKDPVPSAPPDQRASVRLEFDRITAIGGQSAKLDAQVTAVDNARESVDDKGAISGIVASETLSARMDAGINKLSERYPSLGGFLNAIKTGVVQAANPDINFDRGTDFTLKLMKPLNWSDSGGGPGANVRAIQRADQLAGIVSREPFRTVALKPPDASDITNIMLLGTEDQVVEAFKEAGWTTAEARNERSTLETIRAIAEMRGYKEAPVSTLLLDGRPPDLVFQKQNDTFAQRHHIRIWQRPGTFNGRPIWVCAATHDTGITFSPESRTFTHAIDSNIDRERAKVVNDLLFTGTVRAIAIVDRPDIPANAFNATGDKLMTDGRMAVIEF